MAHGLEIRNFSSHVENISLVCWAHPGNIFQHLQRNLVLLAAMYSSIYFIFLHIFVSLEHREGNSDSYL